MVVLEVPEHVVPQRQSSSITVLMLSRALHHFFLTM